MLLTTEITDQEIRKVVKQLPALTAPGPDGSQSIFCKKCWPIVGKMVSDMIKAFLNSGQMLKEINKTYSALVPKLRLQKKYLTIG